MRREFVGRVLVDHGGVAIVDQLYVEISEADEQRIGGGGISATLDCDDDNLPDGFDGVGVFVATALGDGRYPVYADLVEVPGAGERVARIIIDCLGTEPEAPSDELRAELVDAVGDLREQTGGAFDVRLPYDEARVVADVADEEN